MALADTARLVASLELQDKFSRPAGRITGSLNQLEGNFSRIGRGAGQVGSGLARLGTIAATGAALGLGAVVKTAISFEDAFAGVRKTVEATDAELDVLFDSFRQMARETGIAFEEFSRIGAIAGALGVETKAIDEFALAIAKASSATGITVDALADSVGRVGNILDLDEKTYDTFLSTLVELGNKGASTEAEILNITTRFASTGKQAGLTTAQILGLSSAISSLGIQPEAAGSSLSRIMTNFITETANGTDKAKEFARVAGVSFKDFAGVVEKDTLGAVLKFVAGLDGLDKLEKFKALKEAGITGVRDRQAILAFADGIGEVNRQLGVAQDEFGKTNALTEEFRKRQDTVAKQLAIVKENVRDTAFVLGENLLPVVADLSKEFVAFLNLDTTQTGIKQFAKDLGEGIRGLVRELKGTDFSGLIDSLKVAAQVTKTAFDAFNALPGPLKGLLIGALAVNKVSGGALGSIVKGVGNIAIGGGGLLGLGRTPGTAMWVRQVGVPGVGGGVTGAGGKGGSLLRTVGKVFIAGIAIEATLQLAGAIVEGIAGPTIEAEKEIFADFGRDNKLNADELRRGMAAIDQGIADFDTQNAEFGGLLGIIAGHDREILVNQREKLAALLAEAVKQQDAAFENNRQNELLIDEAKAGRLAGESTAARILTLEQKLIQDKTFKPKLDASEFIRILKRTSEFGAKGVGTDIEFGPKTGRDPLGDAFLALVKRVKNPLTPEVFREVSNHIKALEQVQADLIRDGKNEQARHAQRNIDKLAALIGVVDRTRPLLQRGNEEQRKTATNTASYLAKAERALGIAQEQTGVQRGILAKRSSFTVNNSISVPVSVNASLVQERIFQINHSYGSGSGPGGAVLDI